MSDLSSAPRRRVLDAAKTVFARYGFRKASMEDIAREAGVSRPALYQWFGNKKAVFQALAEAIAAEALVLPTRRGRCGVARGRSAAAILAKDLPLYRLLHASPHGAELLAVDEALTSLVAIDLETAFAELLRAKARRLGERGAGLDFSAFDGAEGFGAVVARLAAGLKATAASEDDYTDGVRQLCRIVSAATSRGGSGSEMPVKWS